MPLAVAPPPPPPGPYDRGGVLPAGPGPVANDTGAPIAVLTAQQCRDQVRRRG